MACGGNHKARQFFAQHGWDELGSDKIEGKVCIANQLPVVCSQVHSFTHLFTEQRLIPA